MEKRSYLKPEIRCNELKIKQFIATSGETFDSEEEIQELIGILDGCFQLQGTVSNETVIDYLTTHGNTMCVQNCPPENNEACSDPRYKVSCTNCRPDDYANLFPTYTLTYTPPKTAGGTGSFHLVESNCTNPVTSLSN